MRGEPTKKVGQSGTVVQTAGQSVFLEESKVVQKLVRAGQCPLCEKRPAEVHLKVGSGKSLNENICKECLKPFYKSGGSPITVSELKVS